MITSYLLNLEKKEKERWRQYADEYHRGNMADFIRSTINDYIKHNQEPEFIKENKSLKKDQEFICPYCNKNIFREWLPPYEYDELVEQQKLPQEDMYVLHIQYHLDQFTENKLICRLFIYTMAIKEYKFIQNRMLPVIYSYKDNGHLRFYCKYCHKIHNHGSGGNIFGKGNGFRSPHCHDTKKAYRHYYIKEASQELIDLLDNDKKYNAIIHKILTKTYNNPDIICSVCNHPGGHYQYYADAIVEGDVEEEYINDYCIDCSSFSERHIGLCGKLLE